MFILWPPKSTKLGLAFDPVIRSTRAAIKTSYKIELFFYFPDNILQPSSTMPDLIQPNNTNSSMNKATPVGATWTNSGNLNIDLDNLMGSKKGKAGNAPTMNQLKTNSNNTSPVHPLQSPVIGSTITPTAINFTQGNMQTGFGAGIQTATVRNIPTQQPPLMMPGLNPAQISGFPLQSTQSQGFNANFNNQMNQFNAFQ